jgi:hypothetical protein
MAVFGDLIHYIPSTNASNPVHPTVAPPPPPRYIVVQGSVSASCVRSGQETLLSVTEGGGVLGEMALLTGRERSATLKALENTQCLKLGGDKFRRFLPFAPEIMDDLVKLAQQRRRRSIEVDAENSLDIVDVDNDVENKLYVKEGGRAQKAVRAKRVPTPIRLPAPWACTMSPAAGGFGGSPSDSPRFCPLLPHKSCYNEPPQSVSQHPVRARRRRPLGSSGGLPPTARDSVRFCRIRAATTTQGRASVGCWRARLLLLLLLATPLFQLVSAGRW